MNRKEAYRRALIRNGQSPYEPTQQEIAEACERIKREHMERKASAIYQNGATRVGDSRLRCYHVQYGDGGRAGEFRITPTELLE